MGTSPTKNIVNHFFYTLKSWALTKNRFEIRLKNERADYALKDLLKHEDPEQTAFKIINRYICFVEPEDNKPRTEWKLIPEWEWFIGKHRSSMTLTTKPEPYTLE